MGHCKFRIPHSLIVVKHRRVNLAVNKKEINLIVIKHMRTKLTVAEHGRFKSNQIITP